VTVSLLRRALLLEVKLVLTYVTRCYCRDNYKIMKWMPDVRGKAIMSAERLGGLSGYAGEAKYKRKKVKLSLEQAVECL
jgi:hypothetical protein